MFLESFMVLIFAASMSCSSTWHSKACWLQPSVMIGRYGVGEKKARQRAAMKFLLFRWLAVWSAPGGLVAIWALAARRVVTRSSS